MKSKKLFLPAVIIIAAVLVIAVCSVICGIAKKPTVTEHEFPFSITYELDGEIKTIEEIFTARYVKNGGYTNTKSRIYAGKIGDLSEDTIFLVLRNDENGRIELNTKMYADYLMGDPLYDYFDDNAFEPQILYYDTEENEYTDEETLLAQGIKLISFEYPEPIENSFVFSHISIMDSTVVFPTLLISMAACVVTIIFVKKEEDYIRKPIDVVSIVFNFLIGITVVPFTAIFLLLFDATGDNEGIFNQALYFIPALTVLAITASVALRRKSYGKSAFTVQFIGPAVFIIIIVLSEIF